MKKKIISTVLVIMVALAMMPFATIEANATIKPTYKKLYKISDYRRGDCLLSANVYMMRRAAVMQGATRYKKIKNSSARKKLCYSFNCMNNDYSYTKYRITFKGKHGTLPGGYKKNKAKLRRLLKNHPEGVVVHGYDSYGPHGVLITGYKKGNFYCADSAMNYGNRNRGIVKFKNSTMSSLGGCFQYWCLRKVKCASYKAVYFDGVGSTKDDQKVIKPTKMKCGISSPTTKKKFERSGYEYSKWYLCKYKHDRYIFKCRNRKNPSKVKWCSIGNIPDNYYRTTVPCGSKIKMNPTAGTTYVLLPVWELK